MIKTIKENLLMKNKFFRVYNNNVIFNETHEGEHLLIEGTNQADGISVLPVLSDGSIVLLKNYRYAAKDWLFQVPKGGNGTSFKLESDAIDCATQEMEEEIGYCSNEIEYLSKSFESPSIFNNNMHFLIAYNCVKMKESKEKEETEVIDEIIILKKYEIEEFLKNKKTCSTTLFLVEKYLRYLTEKELKELKNE